MPPTSQPRGTLFDHLAAEDVVPFTPLSDADENEVWADATRIMLRQFCTLRTLWVHRGTSIGEVFRTGRTTRQQSHRRMKPTRCMHHGRRSRPLENIGGRPAVRRLVIDLVATWPTCRRDDLHPRGSLRRATRAIADRDAVARLPEVRHRNAYDTDGHFVGRGRSPAIESCHGCQSARCVRTDARAGRGDGEGGRAARCVEGVNGRGPLAPRRHTTRSR
jgi:hypothetical protein